MSLSKRNGHRLLADEGNESEDGLMSVVVSPHSSSLNKQHAI